jgi:hypothetical protein
MYEDEVDPFLKQLVVNHPGLFRGEDASIWSYVSPGWFGIIDKLCSDIEEISGPDVARIEVQQIKEKFGTLRFYWVLVDEGDSNIDVIVDHDRHGISPEREAADDGLRLRISALVRACEKASASICERCSRPGNLDSDGGWWRTRCEECLRKEA